MRFSHMASLRLFLGRADRSFRFIVLGLSSGLLYLAPRLFHFSLQVIACRLFCTCFYFGFPVCFFCMVVFLLSHHLFAPYNIIMWLFHILRLWLWTSVKIYLKMKLFLQKIWIKLKKCIPLHPLSGTKYWSEKKEFFEEDYIKDREVVQWARFWCEKDRSSIVWKPCRHRTRTHDRHRYKRSVRRQWQAEHHMATVGVSALPP